MEAAPLTEYEQQRAANIARNHSMLANLGLSLPPKAADGAGEQNTQHQQAKQVQQPEGLPTTHKQPVAGCDSTKQRKPAKKRKRCGERPAAEQEWKESSVQRDSKGKFASKNPNTLHKQDIVRSTAGRSLPASQGDGTKAAIVSTSQQSSGISVAVLDAATGVVVKKICAVAANTGLRPLLSAWYAPQSHSDQHEAAGSQQHQAAGCGQAGSMAVNDSSSHLMPPGQVHEPPKTSSTKPRSAVPLLANPMQSESLQLVTSGCKSPHALSQRLRHEALFQIPAAQMKEPRGAILSCTTSNRS
jgi:hypothetical protein